MAPNAAKLGAAIRAENGVDCAARILSRVSQHGVCLSAASHGRLVAALPVMWLSGVGCEAGSFTYKYLGHEFSAVGWFEQSSDGTYTWTTRTGDPYDPNTWAPRTTLKGVTMQGGTLQARGRSCIIRRSTAGAAVLLIWTGGFRWELFDVPA